MSEFGKTVAEAYAVEGAGIDLGRGVHEGALAPEAVVQVPLRMMNRHGLIAGATGTGGADVLGDFLRSREGKTIGKKVARGVFGMLRKRL